MNRKRKSIIIICFLMSLLFFYLNYINPRDFLMLLSSLFFLIAIFTLFQKFIKKGLNSGWIKTNHPPRWVTNRAYNVRWSGANQYIKLKGKKYKYKVVCVGHGQFEYYKKRRH